MLTDEPFDIYAVSVSRLSRDPFPDIVFANSGELNFVLLTIAGAADQWKRAA